MADHLSPGMAVLKRLYDEAGTDERRRRVIKLLAYIKGIWFWQPIDAVIVKVWCDILWDTDPQDARAAVKLLMDASVDNKPPSPRQIKVVAREIREARERRSQRQLVAPGQEVGLTPEEREAGLKVLREAVERVGRGRKE